MAKPISIDLVYSISEDIVTRVIDEELIIIPLVAGIGNLEEELFVVKDTSKAIWENIDGNRSLVEIIEKLTKEYTGSRNEIEGDILGLAQALYDRNIIIEKPRK